MPWVVIANRLRDGIVVFLGPGGDWVERIAESRLARSEPEGEQMMELARRAESEQQVLGPDLIAVEERGLAIVPSRRREAIRALGPSVRRDLGKQAEDP